MPKKVSPHQAASLIANDLLTGYSVFWTGRDWSDALQDAAVATGADAHAALLRIGAEQDQANRITGPYLIAVTGDDGQRTARDIREQVRADGPSIDYRPKTATQREGAHHVSV